MEWIDIKDRLPEINVEVLISNSEGVEIAELQEEEQDGPDCMGHDAGFWGIKFAVPGRSMGQPNYKRKPQGQPTHWMPLPQHPYEVDPFDGLGEDESP